MLSPQLDHWIVKNSSQKQMGILLYDLCVTQLMSQLLDTIDYTFEVKFQWKEKAPSLKPETY